MNAVVRIVYRWIQQKIRKPKRIARNRSRADRGRFGEDLAMEYCKQKLGFRIVTRNWCCKRGEIDLIALDKQVLVFVEVRARAASALVPGVYSLTKAKKKALLRACRAYIHQLQNPPKHVRFDLVDVSINENGTGEVRHYSNIALCSK